MTKSKGTLLTLEYRAAHPRTPIEGFIAPKIIAAGMTIRQFEGAASGKRNTMYAPVMAGTYGLSKRIAREMAGVLGLDFAEIEPFLDNRKQGRVGGAGKADLSDPDKYTPFEAAIIPECRKRGVSFTQLEKLAGIGNGVITRAIRQKLPVGAATAEKIEKCLEMEPGALAHVSVPRKPAKPVRIVQPRPPRPAPEERRAVKADRERDRRAAARLKKRGEDRVFDIAPAVGKCREDSATLRRIIAVKLEPDIIKMPVSVSTARLIAFRIPPDLPADNGCKYPTDGAWCNDPRTDQAYCDAHLAVCFGRGRRYGTSGRVRLNPKLLWSA